MNKQLKVKVCGLLNQTELSRIDGLSKVDFLGLIFYPKSPRCFTEKQRIKATKARKVGVFVDEKPSVLIEKVVQYGLNMIQLHGNETPETCKSLRPLAKVTKVFSVDEEFDFNLLNQYSDSVDYFLFDTATPLKGGSGKKFNWDQLNKYSGRTPFFLSGGIGPEDIKALQSFNHDQLIGVDLNSRFEKSPGIKDVESLQQFLHELNLRFLSNYLHLYLHQHQAY